MKYHYFCPLLALLAPSLSSLQAAPAELPGSVAPFSLALTLSTSVGGTVAKDPTSGKPWPKTNPLAGPAERNSWEIKDETGEQRVESGEERVYKVAVSKYSTKELLLDLVKIGVIEDIKGWSLVKVEATRDQNVNVTAIGGVFYTHAGPSQFYLTHKTLAPVLLEQYLSLDTNEGDPALTLNSKVVTKYNDEGEPTSESFTHTASYKQSAQLSLDIENYVEESAIVYAAAPVIDKSFHVAGVMSSGERLGYFGPAKRRVILASPTKLSGLQGNMRVFDEEENDYIHYFVEGTAVAGAGIAKDVSSFPEVFGDEILSQ
jgi:hypothetical protein